MSLVSAPTRTCLLLAAPTLSNALDLGTEYGCRHADPPSGARKGAILSRVTVIGQRASNTAGRIPMSCPNCSLEQYRSRFPNYGCRCSRAHRSQNGVTNRATKVQLLDEAARCGQLAADADIRARRSARYNVGSRDPGAAELHQSPHNPLSDETRKRGCCPNVWCVTDQQLTAAATGAVAAKTRQKTPTIANESRYVDGPAISGRVKGLIAGLTFALKGALYGHLTKPNSEARAAIVSGFGHGAWWVHSSQR